MSSEDVEKKTRYEVAIAVHAECGHPMMMEIGEVTTYAPTGVRRAIPCQICEVASSHEKLKMMSATVRFRAVQLLGRLGWTPKMYAFHREAFLAHVCGIVSMVHDNFDVRGFYERHMGDDTGLLVTDDWAHEVVKEALDSLEER